MKLVSEQTLCTAVFDLYVLVSWCVAGQTSFIGYKYHFFVNFFKVQNSVSLKRLDDKRL